MDPEAPKEDHLEKIQNSEEHDELVFGEHRAFWEYHDKRLHQTWREQGFTDDEISSWDEVERDKHYLEAAALLRTKAASRPNRNSLTWEEIEKNWKTSNDQENKGISS